MFSKIVPEYHSKNVFVRNLFLKRLEISLNLFNEILRHNKVANVADFGCGDGILLKLLEEKNKDIKTFGIDILPEVSLLKKYLKADITIIDLRKTHFSDNFFDVIFCLDTLEHFENLNEPVNEIKRTLRDGGMLIVSLPTENIFYKLGRFFLKGTFSSKKGPSSSPHFHNGKEMRKFLLKNSFILIKRKTITKIPFFTFFEIILFKKDAS